MGKYFKKNGLGSVLLNLLIGFSRFILFGIIATGMGLLFNNINVGIVSFFVISIGFICYSWFFKKDK
jgi:hypothetical protein